MTIFAVGLAQVNCGHGKAGNTQGNLLELASPKIINFEAQFDIFWEKARKQPFEKQVDLWTSIVEVPHQNFFDTFVWSKTDDPSFQIRRSKQLKTTFIRIAKNEAKVRTELRNFDLVVASQMTRYRETFPDAEFPVLCYAVIGGNFLGRAGISPSTKERVLAFGIDKIVEMEVNPDILYSHELFHIYHGIKSNVDSDDRMIAHLWGEGLASFVSHELNPKVSIKDVFIYESPAQVSDDHLPRIAALFLRVANKRASESKNSQIYFDWFLAETPTKDLPAMAGYWLGYKVAESLRTRYSLAELSHWSVEKADLAATATLKQFAERKSQP